jgi:poly-gamma-glutamate synthesis protein (capsule biosynthesis protein)
VDGGTGQLTLVVAGDVTLGFHFEEFFDGQLADGGMRDELLAYPFAEVAAAARDADIFVVNLECPFTERGEKIEKNFNFRARPQLVEALVKARVAGVSLANNHLMDYGPEGVADTRATLADAGVGFFGAGDNLGQAREPLILERNGVKVAFLGYLFLGEHSIEPPEVTATETTPGVAGYTQGEEGMARILVEDIQRARERADLVIPFFHWGREGYNIPQAYQVRLGRLAIRAGAAAVLGSHPHVIEGMELYQGKPILYSLGNFVFGGNWNPRDKRAAMVRLTFDRAGFVAGEVMPVLVDRFPDQPFQPFIPQGDDGKHILEDLARYSSVLREQLPALAPLREVLPPAVTASPQSEVKRPRRR